MPSPLTEDLHPVRARISVQTYARIGGILLLLSLVAGGFGEAYVPCRLIVWSNANATAQNIQAFASLFQMGFAGYLMKPCAMSRFR
jgi:response regulator of citrate/malate metabolism